jgi:hypothetical protein
MRYGCRMERIHRVSLLCAQGLRYRDGGRWRLTTTRLS